MPTIKKCRTCGKPFSVKNNHAKSRFNCSVKCMTAEYKVKLKGKGNPNFRNASKKKCIRCRETYYNYCKNRKYCTFECYSTSPEAQSHRIKAAPMGNGGYKGRKCVDKNQAQIVKALKKIGCSIMITSNVGGGFPDIIVGRAGKNYLIEIKNPKTHYGKTGLTNSQKLFHSTWSGLIHVAYSVDDVLKIIGVIK